MKWSKPQVTTLDIIQTTEDHPWDNGKHGQYNDGNGGEGCS